MNFLSVATFFCLAALCAAHGHDDGQWRGEGLLESQDHYGAVGHYAGVSHYAGVGHYGAVGHYAGVVPYAGHYAHGAAPLGHDGRVIDTPAVAAAKVQHYAAYSNAAHENHAHAGHGYGYAGHGYGHGAYAAPALYAGHGYAGHGYAAYAAPAVYAGHGAVYAHGHGAPLAHDGRVVDTPEVAHAKAQHFAAKAHASHGAYHHY